MDATNDILALVEGRGLHITLNRPDHGNAASDAMAIELTRLIDSAHEQADYVVLRGAGADFCTGRWVTGGAPAGPVEAYEARRRFDVVFNCYSAFRRSPLPIIGVVQGKAHGFGCALAALCDITMASDAASFCVPEMRHYVLPTMVASALADRVSPKALLYLIYSTAEVDAARALSFGLVSEIVPAAELEGAMTALTAQIGREPRPAVMGLKEFARTAMRMDTAGMVDFARNLHATVNTSSEMRRTVS
jgi:enoyl-CoA hydratase